MSRLDTAHGSADLLVHLIDGNLRGSINALREFEKRSPDSLRLESSVLAAEFLSAESVSLLDEGSEVCGVGVAYSFDRVDGVGHQGSSRVRESAGATADSLVRTLGDAAGRDSSRARPAELPTPINGDAIARVRKSEAV